MIASTRERGITSRELNKRTGQDTRLIIRRLNALSSLGYIRKYEIPVKQGHGYMNVYSKFVSKHKAFPREHITPCEISYLRSFIIRLVKQGPSGVRLLQHLWEDVGLPNSLSAKEYFLSVVRQLVIQGFVTQFFVTTPQDPKRRYFCIKYVQDIPKNDEFEDDFVEDQVDTLFNDSIEDATSKYASTIDPEPEDLDHSPQWNPLLSSRGRVHFNQYYPLDSQLLQVIKSGGQQGVVDYDISNKLTGPTFVQPNTRSLELISGNSRLAAKKLSTYLKSPLGYLAVIRGIDHVEHKRNFRYFTNTEYIILQKTAPEPNWGTFRLSPTTSTLLSTEKDNFIRIPGQASIVISEEGIAEVKFYGPIESLNAKGKGKAARRVTAERIPDIVDSLPVRKKLALDVPENNRISSLEGSLEEKLLSSASPAISNPAPETIQVQEEPEIKVEPEFTVPSTLKRKELSPLIESASKRRHTLTAIQPPEIIEISSSSRDTTPGPPDKTHFTRDSNDDIVDIMQPCAQSTEASHILTVDQHQFVSSPLPPVASNKEIDGEMSLPEAQSNQAEVAEMEELSQMEYNSHSGAFFLDLPTTAALNKMSQNLNCLEILQSNEGVMSSKALLDTLNEKYYIGEDHTLGKRPFTKTIKRLEKLGQLRQIYVTVPYANGDSHVTKTIIIHRSVDEADERISNVKQDVIADIRAKCRLRMNQVQHGLNYYRQTPRDVERLEATRVADEQAHMKEEKRQALENQREAKKYMKMVRAKKKTDEMKAARSSIPSARLTRLKIKEHKNGQISTQLQFTSKVNVDIFFRVVVIARSLFGGSLSIINWDKVAEAMPGLTSKEAKTLWPRVHKQMATDNLDLIVATWEKIFLQAYEDGEIPIFRYGNYDLYKLALFWRRKYPQISGFYGVPLLYEDPKENEARYDFVAKREMPPFDICLTTTSQFVISKALMQWSMASEKPAKPVSDMITQAKSAIRSIIATPSQDYSKARGRDILLKFGEQVVAFATSELEKERAIVYIPRSREKIIPDRNFAFSEKFTSTLKPKLGGDAFAEMTEFYQDVLSTLNSSNGYIMSRTAPDYCLICILDLVCHEKADLVRVNIANGPAVGKDDCDIVVRTPLRYIGSAEQATIDEVRRSKKRSVPVGEPGSTIWTDVRGRANRGMWQKLIYWMLLNIEIRPGVTIDGLHSHISFVVSREEVAMLVKWLVKKYIIRKGHKNGYYVLPEWYAHVPF